MCYWNNIVLCLYLSRYPKVDKRKYYAIFQQCVVQNGHVGRWNFWMSLLLLMAGLIKFLTHSFPMNPFSTLWKHQKVLRFSDVLEGKERLHWERMCQKYNKTVSWNPERRQYCSLTFVLLYFLWDPQNYGKNWKTVPQ